MTTNMRKKIFFGNKDNEGVMSEFIRIHSPVVTDDSVNAIRLRRSQKIIRQIITFPDDWDNKCKFNINDIGDKFIRQLSDFDSTDIKNIADIYVFSYRFLYEFSLFVDGRQMSDELFSIKNEIENSDDENNGDIQSRITHASYVMPLNMIKYFFDDPNIKALKEFEQHKTDIENLKKDLDTEIQTKRGAVKNLKKDLDTEIQTKRGAVENLKKDLDTEIQTKRGDLENLKKDLDTEIQTKTADVDALKKSLEKYKIGFNFVGLYQGFDDLAKEKQKERDGILIWLITLSVVTFVPIIVQMRFIYNHVAKISSAGFGDAVLTFFTLSTLSTLSIVAIAIYYFRVLLFNYKSVKSQLLQIDLRKTLCRFIQSYATYSSEIKKQDPKSLEKFESIIFSGIATDERNQPSPFYVGEQIEKLIEKFAKQ